MIFKKPSIKGQLSPSTAQASAALCIHSIKSFVSLYIIDAEVGGAGGGYSAWGVHIQHPPPALLWGRAKGVWW